MSFNYRDSDLVFMALQTLSAADLRDEKISALVAAKLREFHDLDMPGPKTIQLWNRLRYLLIAISNIVYQYFVKTNGHNIYNLPFLRNWLRAARSLCPPEEAEEYCLDIMEEEITDLENEFSGQNQRIGFCHNDLQYGNIMIDEETSLVTIIVSFFFCQFSNIIPIVLQLHNLPPYAELYLFLPLIVSVTI